MITIIIIIIIIIMSIELFILSHGRASGSQSAAIGRLSPTDRDTQINCCRLHTIESLKFDRCVAVQ